MGGRGGKSGSRSSSTGGGGGAAAPQPQSAAAFTGNVNNAIDSIRRETGSAVLSVPIGDVYDRVGSNMSRDEFNRQLANAANRGDVILKGADMPGAVPNRAKHEMPNPRPNSNREFVHYVQKAR